jgi:hypothetical protein
VFVNLGNLYLVLKRFLQKCFFQKISGIRWGPPDILFPVGAQELPPTPPHEMSPPRILTYELVSDIPGIRSAHQIIRVSGIRYLGGGTGSPQRIGPRGYVTLDTAVRLGQSEQV